MRLLTIVLLACLLVAGSASAVAINPASVGAAKTIEPVSPQVQRNVASVLPVTIVTQQGRGMLEVYSVPSGATVTLDGTTNSGEKTPVKYSLFAGSHTVVIALEGYNDYTETFNLDAGAIKSINADLVRKPGISVPGARLSLEASDTRKPATTATIVQIPGALTRITTGPVPVTTTPTITMVCPNADWSCLTEAEAAQQFGYPNARYGDEPCGFVPVNNLVVYKYCFMDVTSWSLPPGALAATGIREGDDIYIMNDTWIEHAVVNKTPAVTDNGDVFQPVFNFFSSIISGKLPTPAERLERVGLNPCPEPPAQAPLVGRVQ